jgi:hypothetical protein
MIDQVENDVHEEFKIYDVDNLLCFITQAFSGAIEHHCTHYGKGGLTLGYSRLWRLTAIRLYIYLTENPIAWDVSLICSTRIAKEIPNSSHLQVSIDNSFKRLCKNAIHTYKKILKKAGYSNQNISQYLVKQLYSLIWEAAKAKIASDDEGIIRAAKGDEAVCYVPYAAAMDLINEFNKTKLEKRSLDHL